MVNISISLLFTYGRLSNNIILKIGYFVNLKEKLYFKKYIGSTAGEERLVLSRHLDNKSGKKKTREYLMYLHDSCVG